jgi:Mor family transcriptional regulator
MVSSFMKAEEFDYSGHEEIREVYRWGSFGKQWDEGKKVSILKNLSNNHIYNILRTQHL